MIENYTGDKDIIGIPDESIEIKDTKESKKDDVPTNDKNFKEISHNKKRCDARH